MNVRQALVRGAVAAATVGAGVGVPLAVLNSSGPSHPAATAGAPQPGFFGFSSSCAATAPTLPDETNKMIKFLTTTPGPITLPYQACYRIDGNFRLPSLNNITINGNGATMVQVLPAEGGYGGSTECGQTDRLFVLNSTNVNINNISFIGAGDTSPITSSATATAQAGTWTPAGNIVFNHVPTYGAPAPPGTQIQVGNIVSDPQPGAAGLAGYWYVTNITGTTVTITAGTGGANIGPGTGSVAVGDSVTFNSNTGQHCEGGTGIELQGNTNVQLSGISVTNTQGDLLSLQLPSDPLFTSNPVNMGIRIANSTFTNAGYDCISIEATAGNGTGDVNSSGLLASGDTWHTCKEDNLDMETDEGSSSFGGASSNICQFSCNSNVLFVGDTFTNWAVQFYVSPNGQCPGVQKQHVTFQNDTLKQAASGLTVQGTYPPDCTVTTNHNATAITTIGANPAIVTGSVSGWGPGAPITGPGLVGPWNIVVVEIGTNTTEIAPGAGGSGAPMLGTYTATPGPAPTVKNLSIYLTFTHNTMIVGNSCNATNCGGFSPPFSADPNCSDTPPCPDAFSIHFIGLNNIVLTNNTFFLHMGGFGPYQATFFLQNVNGMSIENNNFYGTYPASLFWRDTNNANNVTDCGNMGGPSTAPIALDATC